MNDRLWSLHRRQIEEIEKAVKEADGGLFASEDDVEQLFSKWSV